MTRILFLLLRLMVASQLPSSQSRGRMHYPSYYRITTSIAANPLMFYPQIFLKSLKTYTGFLLEIKARSFRVICVSTPLPTIKDGNDWGEIANARKEISATQVERTALTLAFNQQIEAFCQLEGISFINLDKRSLGENGTVNPSLLNSNPNNHHYEPQAYAALLVRPLKDVATSKAESGRTSRRLR